MKTDAKFFVLLAFYWLSKLIVEIWNRTSLYTLYKLKSKHEIAKLGEFRFARFFFSLFKLFYAIKQNRTKKSINLTRSTQHHHHRQTQLMKERSKLVFHLEKIFCFRTQIIKLNEQLNDKKNCRSFFFI